MQLEMSLARFTCLYPIYSGKATHLFLSQMFLTSDSVLLSYPFLSLWTSFFWT